MNPLVMALCGTGFTFLMTALGAALVFFFKKEVSDNVSRIFMGFAAGVMIAASVWSLLIPSIEATQERGGIGWIPAAGGFLLGALFLYALDRLLPHMHAGSSQPEGLKSSMRRSGMLVMAVTLHNIPEGMAVGLAFSLAAQNYEAAGALGSAWPFFMPAIALAIGMGIQNFPEGTAISLPLRKEGVGRFRAFLYGALSGIVEPVFGLLAVLVAGAATAVIPWFLAFAAGAMIFVVVEELIPEAMRGSHSHTGTFAVIAGFVVMMILDVALG